MFDLSGKNVVYVGGFSGVGFQVCRTLIKKKINHLVVCGRIENAEMLKKLQAEGQTTQTKVSFVQTNIAQAASVEQAVKQIVGIVKHIDVLINGVGIIADKDVETTINVNLTGLIHTTLASLPHMDKSQMGHGGVVLNISSVYGIEPAPAFAVYAAAKHGVVGFTRSMGNDHLQQKTGVHFIAVCPGLTSTEEMVNLRENVTVHHVEELAELLDTAKRQTAEECAVNVVKALESSKNGAIYISNLGELKEIVSTVHWHL